MVNDDRSKQVESVYGGPYGYLLKHNINIIYEI